MGLDLVVEGCSKPGHETEWRDTLERSFAEEELSEAEISRFQEISVPPYERLGAPRVGFDQAANDWIVRVHGCKSSKEAHAVLQEFHGQYALPLVKSDGLPRFSHANLYEAVDETSFRGSFLEACTDVLTRAQIAAAWEHRMPDSAIAYGRQLLNAADKAERNGEPAPPRAGLLSRLGLTKSKQGEFDLREQVDIVRTAGKWFIFWGNKGHAIRAYF